MKFKKRVHTSMYLMQSQKIDLLYKVSNIVLNLQTHMQVSSRVCSMYALFAYLSSVNQLAYFLHIVYYMPCLLLMLTNWSYVHFKCSINFALAHANRVQNGHETIKIVGNTDWYFNQTTTVCSFFV